MTFETTPEVAAKIAELVAENQALRGICATIMPCHYCGVSDIGKCPHGFPGCALADDTLAATDETSKTVRELRAEVAKLKAEIDNINADRGEDNAKHLTEIAELRAEIECIWRITHFTL